jgi:hypothetical protein
MSLRVHQAITVATDADEAVRALAEEIGSEPISALLIFVYWGYDLPRLASALEQAFDCPIIGCTTAGQISARGFQREGITAVALRGETISVTPYLIKPLDRHIEQAERIAEGLRLRPLDPGFRRFGLLLVDGLSLMEEQLAASLYQALDDVPLIGGSAGDDLSFRESFVYFNGHFHDAAAVFAVFETSQPFVTFKTQHFEATEKRLVTTTVDAPTRTILELNGEPAAITYARTIGVPVETLSPRVFSQHPFLLRIGGEQLIRSIQSVNPDLSLTCYCAIEEGLVLSIAQASDPLMTLELAFESMRTAVPEPALVIACDCILRRLQFEDEAIDEDVGRFFAEHGVVGFSTYGEQFNAVHVNQTFAGIAIGR